MESLTDEDIWRTLGTGPDCGMETRYNGIELKLLNISSTELNIYNHLYLPLKRKSEEVAFLYCRMHTI